MLHIIQSNRMEALQLHLSQLLHHDPLTSIFDKEMILVQSPGIAQWLKVELGSQLGIAGQMDFVLPSSFIWRLYQQTLDDVPKQSAFNKQNMAWKIHAILPDCLSLPEFSSLANYVGEDTSDTKVFSLCEKIADAYDQYLMYRPQWLSAWLINEPLHDVDVSLAPWQPELWRRLVAHTSALGQPHHHRANLHQSLLEKLAYPNVQLKESRVIIFGMSAMPLQQIEIMSALSQKIDVYLYLNNPSCHYWGDVIDEKTQAKIAAKYVLKPFVDAPEKDYFYVGNPLLASWGKLGRDYLEQLVQLDAQWHDIFIENFDNTLLSHIQKDIFNLTFKGQTVTSDAARFIDGLEKTQIVQDDSVVLVDCHSPVREVEALHDHLLNMFEKNPALTPKDIVVMMPDVSAYTPYIDAIFGRASGDLYIPYAISDLAIDKEKPILTSFIQLASICQNRFTVSEILDLLQVEAIAAKFSIELEQLDQIGYWLEQVKIRWAIDGEHKVCLQQPNIELNTWQQGLNRLMLGTVQSDELAEYSGIYPADEVEGMATEILGLLITFFDKLVLLKKQLDAPTNIAEKVALHRQVIHDFYDSEHHQSWDLLLINTMLDDLMLHYEERDYSDPISQSLMVQVMNQALSNKGVGQRFLSGQVNICTLMPMRAVPFKVVCILGLNDADYPRIVQPLGFDLLHHSAPKKGDRSRKLDDRYLFLEALMSTREQLYLSYVGRSALDNSERMPSNLVSELCEYMDRSFYFDDENKGVTKGISLSHYLQPFNEAYFSSGELQTHHATWLASNEPQNQTQNDIIVARKDELGLDELIFAVTNPQQAFYQQTVGVRLPEFDYINQDDEPFAVDALTQYGFLGDLVRKQLDDSEICEPYLVRQGALPQSNVGVLGLQTIKQRTEPLVAHLSAINYQTVIQQKFSISVLGCDLAGYLNLCGKTQVFYRPASIKAKDLIKAYLYHLSGIVSGFVTTTVFCGIDTYAEFSPIEEQQAGEELNKWLEFYYLLQSKPVAFFPTSSLTYAMKENLNAANGKFETAFVGRGEGENPYVALDFESLFDVEDEFCELSESLMAPIVASVKEHKYA